LVVTPAGTRDYVVDASGRGSSEDINALYATLLTYARSIDPRSGDDLAYDTVRFAIQKKCLEIFEHLENILSGPSGGKRGLLQRKLGSRNLALGARNVISAATFHSDSPDSPTFHDVMTTKLPLVVALKAFQPVVVYWLRHFFLNAILNPEIDQIAMIDPETGKTSFQTISSKEKDLFTTSEGLSKLITLFTYPSLRNKPVIVHNDKNKSFYLYYVYEEDDAIYFTRSKSSFVENYEAHFGKSPDADALRPITYAEMFYIAAHTALTQSGSEKQDKLVEICRYPAIEIGSAYLSRSMVMSTEPSRTVRVGHLAEGLNMVVYPMYPILDAEYVDSTILHPAWLTGLGGDYDGDMVSNNGVMNDASLIEGDEYLHSARSLLLPSGNIGPTIATDVTKLVFHNLSWAPDLA